MNSIQNDGGVLIYNGKQEDTPVSIYNTSIDYWRIETNSSNLNIFDTDIAPSLHGDDNPSITDAVPVMTGATSPSGTAYASSEHSATYAAWKGFNDTWAKNDDVWHRLDTPDLTAWLTYAFDSAIIINKYTMISRLDYPDQMPTTWRIYGSTTDAFTGEEVLIDTKSGISWVNNVKQTFTFDNGNEYISYRIVITIAESADFWSIGNMELIKAQPK